MENATLELIKNPSTTALHNRDLDINKISDAILKINQALTNLDINQIAIQKALSKTEKAIKKINNNHFKIIEQYEAINEARLAVIKKQQAQLKLFRISLMIKHFFWPRIGILYQHDPRAFTYPKHYKKKIHLAQTPTISIVTPSYNQGQFIEETIQSVVDQNYPALEYIIQDGGSSDDSVAIIQKYNKQLKHWETKKDKGQSHALNQGFKHATGEIMAYLNSDDILLPGSLHYVANYFNKHPEVDVVYGHRILLNENNGTIGKWILPRHNSNVLTWADYIPQETLFWRRSIWEKAGGKIDETFKFAMDWDLLLRFREQNAVFKRLPRFLGAFRIHTHQKTSAKIKTMGLKEMDKLRFRCHGRKVSYLEIKKNTFFYLVENVILHKLNQLGILRY